MAGTTFRPTRRQCLRSSLVVAACVVDVLGTLRIEASRRVVVRPVGQRRDIWMHRLAFGPRQVRRVELADRVQRMQRTEDGRRHVILLGRKRGNGPTVSLAPLQPVSQLTHRVLPRLQKPLQPCLDRAPALAACDYVPQEEVLRIRGPASH